MKISVVIPARNEAAVLPKCLESLADQTRPPDEIIVVDNASEDGTVQSAVKFPSVIVQSQVKVGRVHARNAGFAAATGDIIARIDADTVVPPDWLEHIESFYAQKKHANDAWTGGAHFDNVPLSWLVSRTYNWLVFDFNTILLGHPTLWGSNMALPKETWLSVARETCRINTIHEDLDLSIHLHKRGVTIYRDKTLPVGAHMRRVLDDRAELWSYLKMWPNTLRHHGIRSWPVCWLIGVVPLYVSSYSLAVLNGVFRLFRHSNNSDRS